MDTASADTVFVGGSLFTAGMTSSSPGAVAVRGGRIAAVGPTTSCASSSAPPPRSSTWPAACWSPASRTPTCTRSSAASTCCAATSTTLPSAEEALATVADLRRRAPRPASGSSGGGWSMEHFAGRHPDPRGARRGRARPPRLPHQPRRPRHLGQHARPSSSRASTRRHPDPADGRIERDARRHPRRHPARGRRAARGAPAPRRHRGRSSSRACVRRRSCCSRSASRPGRTRQWASCSGSRTCSHAYLAAAADGLAAGPRGRRAVVGPRARRRADRRPRATVARAAGSAGSGATTVKIMQDGVAENFTAGMLEPYLDGCGCSTANCRSQLRRPGRAAPST